MTMGHTFSRYSTCVFVAAGLSLASIVNAQVQFVGTYRCVSYDRGKPFDEVKHAQFGPKSVWYLELRKDMTFTWRSIVRGHTGTWKVAHGNVYLNVFTGYEPYPKPDQPLILRPKPDRRRLVLNGVSPNHVEFNWDPKAKERWLKLTAHLRAPRGF
jgi:hypothetical protein